MEKNSISKSECILENITKLPITIITRIFAYQSDNPISFLHIISKSKKMQLILYTLLSNINPNNQLSKKVNEYIFKYKLSQKIYLSLLEKTISNKIHRLPLTLPTYKDEPKTDYIKKVQESFAQLFDKYQSLKILCNDSTYWKKKNRWFLEKMSEKNVLYFNNCIFMVNNVEDIESIISLLYNNDYLNYKTTLTVNKVKDDKIKKIILEDEHINYYLEYPRSILFKSQFISQLLKLNINFYICSFDYKSQLNNITYQSINNDDKNKKIFLNRKKLSIDYNSLKGVNNIISNIRTNNNIINTDKNIIKNKKNNPMIINKSSISFKEINLYLKEYKNIDVDTIIFQNILIENSFFTSFFGIFSSNKNLDSNKNNNYNNEAKDNFNILKFSKNIFDKNKNKLMFNFEKDFFEVNINDKMSIINCSELINYIKNYKNLKYLYLFNFPLEDIKYIKNPFIEYIYINNFFNFENGIILTIDKINKRLPQLSKIKIKVSDFNKNKEFIFIKRNDTFLGNITLNLLDDNIEINYIEINSYNLPIIPKTIFSILKSFKGIHMFIFNFVIIKKYENEDGTEQIDFINDAIFEKINKIDINVLKYLSLENLMIYGYILNGIKSIKYYINGNNTYNNLISNENKSIFKLISNNINSFSESNYSLFFINEYFFVPFIEDIILKIRNNELQKFLYNCNNLLYILNLYNIDIMNTLYNIRNNHIKNISIFLIDNKYDFSDKNKNEFNLRYIYTNIPSLKSIKINLINHKLKFNKNIIPFICFKLYYENDNKNKNKLVVDFGHNDELFKNIKKKRFNKFIINNFEGYIIFIINDMKIIRTKYGKIIKPFNINDINDNIIKILIFIYILTLGIIFLINFL